MQCGYALTYAQEAAILATGVMEPQVREEEPQHAGKTAAHRTKG
jgi:hypothetical protein